jgi:hypothetical protein
MVFFPIGIREKRMATVMTQPAVRPRLAIRLRAYVPIGLVCFVIAVAGFWPSYFGPLVLSGRTHPVPIIHLHAIVFVGWIAFLISQAWLAATGRIALHMKVGKVGMAWGVLVILVGCWTAVVRSFDHLAAGNLQRAEFLLFVGLTDMLVFTPFLAAAWIYRRRPQIHKRLIIGGTTLLLIAAVHRMTFLGGRPPPLPQLLAVWLSPILIGMAYDWTKRRIVHPVYLIGIGAVLLLKFGRDWVPGTAAWKSFYGWMQTL